jgi:hypothetical protein
VLTENSLYNSKTLRRVASRELFGEWVSVQRTGGVFLSRQTGTGCADQDSWVAMPRPLACVGPVVGSPGELRTGSSGTPYVLVIARPFLEYDVSFERATSCLFIELT